MIIIDNENVGWDAEREAGTRRTFFLNRVEFAFRYCPPGTFLMGSPEDEEERQDDETQLKVTLTRGFWLLETPVTQGMYEALTHSNPSWFSEKALGGSSPGCFSNRWESPVEQVSWDDCQMFCRWLNAYASRVAPEGFEFRLPTEAEWEYACRAGTTGPYNVDGASLGALGWYGENSATFSIGQTHPVRRKNRTLGGYAICTATCGNGAPTGTDVTARRRKRTRRGRRRTPIKEGSTPGSAGGFTGTSATWRRTPTGFCAAVVGTTAAGVAGRLTGTSASRRAGLTTPVFASR